VTVLNARRSGGDGVLAARGLAVGYAGRRRRVVLDGVDAELNAGELVCLLGANGTGKSTLLRTLAGLQPALAGSVTLLGEELAGIPAAERARRLAVVLTEPVDAGLLSGYDLVALGRYPHTGWDGRLDPGDHAVVRWALEATATARFADRPVAELSDGERQRLVVARALAQEPAVLVLDEPTAFVDLPRRVELVSLLRALARECDLAVLLSTHDLDLALRWADTLWIAGAGAGADAVAGADAGAGAGLRAGGPEDLVLDGSLARAFASDRVRFDVVGGGFAPAPDATAGATVAGDGPRAVWARRALERSGYRLAAPGDAADVEVRAHPSGWTLAVDGRVTEHRLLADLVAHLRAHRADARPRTRAPVGPR